MTVRRILILLILIQINSYLILSAKNGIKRRNINKVSYTSSTKSEWTYQPSPRVGSLFIRLENGKKLYPGLLNCNRNKVTQTELKQNLFMSFPSARSGHTYTMVIYKNNYLVSAVINIKGEDLYEGRLNGHSIAELSDLDKSDVNETVYVEILEQGKDKYVPESTYDRNEWTSIYSKWNSDFMTGTASKTCLIIVPEDRVGDNSDTSADDNINDITMLFNQFLIQSN